MQSMIHCLRLHVTSLALFSFVLCDSDNEGGGCQPLVAEVLSASVVLFYMKDYLWKYLYSIRLVTVSFCASCILYI